MQDTLYFPAVDIQQETENHFRASVIIKIDSILSPLLRDDKKEKELDSLKNFKSHHAFLVAVSAWPKSITLGLNIFTKPDLNYPMGGKLVSTILLSVTAPTKKKVITEILSRHTVLISLLNNYFPAIEFTPVVIDNELKQLQHPFEPSVAMGIGRRQIDFIVSRSKKNAQNNQQMQTIGFLTTDQVQAEKKTKELKKISYLFPWIASEDMDISTVAEAMLCNSSPLWLQIRLRPGKASAISIRNLTTTLHQCEDLLAAEYDNETSLLTVQLKAMRDAVTDRLQQLSNRIFIGGVFLCSTTNLDEALIKAVAATISPNYQTANEQKISLYGGITLNSMQAERFTDLNYFFEKEPFTPQEAACMFRIPHPKQENVSGLPIKEYRTALARSTILHSCSTKGLLLGHNVHRGYRNEVRLSVNDRMKHACILGQTGTGKSTLLSSMIVQDINADRGLCLIDPHGDLVEDILQRFPEKRIDDLVLVDFLDQQNVVPLNLLYWKDQEERDFIIDDMYCWLDQAYDMRETGGPMFELYFRSFLRMLMGDRPRQNFIPNIGDFVQMFLSERFRTFCGKDVHDSQVHRMIRQANRARGDAGINNIAPYITSKLNRFDLDKNLMRMTGQETMVLDFTDIMDNGKVMLVNLGRGRFGETVTGLLASQLISRFKAAAMKRVNIAPEKRRDFFLYVDEFQNIASSNFISMLSEARKFRLGLVLANQYASQLEEMQETSGGSVLKAILGNVGTIVNFRLGIEDAELMERVYTPDFNQYDLANLPMGNCYVSLKTGGNKPIAVSMETVYEKVKPRSGHIEKLRATSMKKYTISVEKADENIEERFKKIERLMDKS